MVSRSLVRKSRIGRRLANRRLFVVDIENLVGAGEMSVLDVERAKGLIALHLDLRDGDQCVVASSHRGFLSVHAAWKGVRLLVGSGENGADLELLSVLDSECVEDRFGEVVLVSGDGIFTDIVHRLGSAGVEVTVAANSAALSKRLRMAAGRVVILDSSVDEPVEMRIAR